MSFKPKALEEKRFFVRKEGCLRFRGALEQC